MQAEGRAPLSGDEVASAPESAEPGAARRQTRLVFIVAGIVVLLDQVSKAVIVATMADRAPIELLGGLLTITYTRNPGAAFSIGTGYTWIFTLVAIAVVVIIIRTSRHLYSAAWAVALGGLLGGALGNLIDRIVPRPGPGPRLRRRLDRVAELPGVQPRRLGHRLLRRADGVSRVPWHRPGRLDGQVLSRCRG